MKGSKPLCLKFDLCITYVFEAFLYNWQKKNIGNPHNPNRIVNEFSLEKNPIKLSQRGLKRTFQVPSSRFSIPAGFFHGSFGKPYHVSPEADLYSRLRKIIKAEGSRYCRAATNV